MRTSYPEEPSCIKFGNTGAPTGAGDEDRIKFYVNAYPNENSLYPTFIAPLPCPSVQLSWLKYPL
jgi:hypothetical protein